MYYYKFHIGDYKAATDHLDLMEDLAYRRMLDWCYLNERSLPLDLNDIAKRILMRTHNECIANVLNEYLRKQTKVMKIIEFLLKFLNIKLNLIKLNCPQG